MICPLFDIIIFIVFFVTNISCDNEKYRYGLFNENSIYIEPNQLSFNLGQSLWLRLSSVNSSSNILWLRLESKTQNQFPIVIHKNEERVHSIQTDTQSHKCLYLVTTNFIPYHNEFPSIDLPLTTKRIEKEMRFVSKIPNIVEHMKHLTVSLCDGISGIGKLYNSSKYIYFNADEYGNTINTQVLSSSTSETILSQNSPLVNQDILVQRLFDTAGMILSRHKRSKRSAFHMPVRNMPGPYLVELYIIVDSKMATMFRHRNYMNLIHRITFIMNQINMAFSQFNIYFTVIQLEIWEHDQIKLTDENHILMELQLYKRRFINKRHDCLHAILGENLGTSRRGQSEMASMCGYNRCVGYTKDYSSQNELEISHAVLHEIGHNFGLHHDTEQCKCYGCIMATGIESGSFTFSWSNCSTNEIRSLLKSGMADCLLDEPPSNMGKMNPVIMEVNRLSQYIESYTSSKCGNGVVDEGEQCDCGGRNRCEAEFIKCCNPDTCLFTKGSSCAGGSCCDLDRCSLKTSGMVCRGVGSESCDLPEYCNGKSEWCPSDVYKQDGIKCTNKITGEYSHCYRGKCASRQFRCQQLWGDTAEISNDVCYDMNKIGNNVNNCGLEIPREADRDRQPKNWNTRRCSKENSICGRLWCSHENERVFRLSKQFMTNEIVNGYHCSAVRFDMDWYLDDYGMVPNGVSCGSGKMCWKSECIPVNSLELTRCYCHEHGDCNNRGNCHCHSGFSFPNCTTKGDGGSIDSGPPPKFNHLSRIIISSLLIIVIVILTIFVIMVFIYHYHNRTWPYFINFIKCPNYKFSRSKLLILCHKRNEKAHSDSNINKNNDSNVTLLSEQQPIDMESRYDATFAGPLFSDEKFRLNEIEIRKARKDHNFQSFNNDNVPYLKPTRPKVINIDAKCISNETNKPLNSATSPKSPDKDLQKLMSVKEKAQFLENKGKKSDEKNNLEKHNFKEKSEIEKKLLKNQNFNKPEILTKKPAKNSDNNLNVHHLTTTAKPILSDKPQKTSSTEKCPSLLSEKPQKSLIAESRPPILSEKPKKISNIETDVSKTESKAQKVTENIYDSHNKPMTEQQSYSQSENKINQNDKVKNFIKPPKPLKFQISEPKLNHSTNELASSTFQIPKESLPTIKEKGPIISQPKPFKNQGELKLSTNSQDEHDVKLKRLLKFQISQPRLEQTTCIDETCDLPVVDKTLTRIVAPHKILRCDPSTAVNFKN